MAYQSAYFIKELTDDEIKKIKLDTPLAEPKRFQVYTKAYTIDFCDTREEAEAIKKQHEAEDQADDVIQRRLEALISEAAEQFEMTEEAVRGLIKSDLEMME
jgi:hypothetical protein